MYKEFNTFQDSNNCYDCKGKVKIPSCIDDDYCVASPMPRNNGILAMAFVDIQPIDNVYAQNIAFCKGTLFPNLDMPFYGGKDK